MTDFLSGIGDAATKAFDFLTPTTDRRGAGFGVGDLINGLGDAVENSALGGALRLPDLLQSDMDWSDKLLWSGAIAAGGFIGARQLHGAMKVERGMASLAEDAVKYARPARSEIGRAIGLPERFAPSTVEGEAIVRQFPGIKPRTADVLGSKDWNATALHLTDLTDELQLGAAAGIVERYSARLVDVDPAQRLGAAQSDWAKVQLALEHGVITKGANPEIHALWDQFSKDPLGLTVKGGKADPAKAVRLMDLVQQVGDATRGMIEPDLSFDVVSRVSKIDLTENGTVVHLSTPVGWDPEGALDQGIRSARIKKLNARHLAPRAAGILKQLYKQGMSDEARFLDRGSDWYGFVHNEILQELGQIQDRHPWLDMERLTAAVSLTSEATDWDQNIALAVRALDSLSKRPEFTEDAFQKWLRDTSGAKEGDGSAFQKMFDEIHDELTAKNATEAFRVRQEDFRARWKAIPAKERPPFEEFFQERSPGNFLSAKDLKKVMRLFSETGADVFSTTNGQKQKNFYLNMLTPESADPVTIDRHAYDIFYGIATHSDFKGLELRSFGDDMYEVMADVYRQVADELGVKPHQVQGVTWQTWRVLKDEWNAKSNNYERGRGPFRLPEEDGAENLVYQAITGQHTPKIKNVFEGMPDRVVYVTGGEGEGVFVNPDGSLGVAAPIDKNWTETLRHLYPAVIRPDGVAMWGRGYAAPVRDLSALRAELAEVAPDAPVEVWSAGAFGGELPTERAAPIVTIELPEGGQVPAGFEGRLQRAGEPVNAEGPAKIPGDLRQVDVAEFVRVRKYLNKGTERKGQTTIDKMLSKIPDDLNEWKGHRFWMTADGKAGFAISSDGDLQQVFNFSDTKGFGGQMVEYAKTQGARTLDFYDGQFLEDGTIGPGFLGDFYAKHGFEPTERFDWDPQYDAPLYRPNGPPVQMMALSDGAAVEPARVAAAANRAALRLTEQELADVPGLVAKLESAGARVVTVHAPGRPPEGWVAARENVFTDGVSKMVVRSSAKDKLAPHGYTVWVRAEDAQLLPSKVPYSKRNNGKMVKAAPNPTGTGVRYGHFATADTDVIGGKGGAFVVQGLDGSSVPNLQSTAVPTFDPIKGSDPLPPNFVRKIGDRFIVNSPDMTDVTTGSKIVELLERLGVPPERIRHNIGQDTVRMDYVDPKPERGMVTTQFGLQMPEVRRTGTPRPEWIAQYGVRFDTHARSPEGDLVRLDPKHLPVLDGVMSKVHEDPTHVEMFRLAGFDRIHLAWHDIGDVTKWDVSGWYESKAGGAVALNAVGWREGGDILDAIAENQASKYFNPNMPGDGSSILAHEIAHVMHQGLIFSFPTKGAYLDFEKAVLKKMKTAIGGKKKMTVALSGYANLNVDEFVAEAIAEALISPAPRPLAMQVYNTVVDQFRKNRAVTQSGRKWAP
jgi:hypothetical protein